MACVISLSLDQIGRKEMFYLTIHSIHMVKDHSDSERGNQLPRHGLIFPISSKGYALSHRHEIAYYGQL